MEGPSSVTECIPESLEFGFCPINETTTRTILIQNPSRKKPTRFSIINSTPFKISPLSATIQPRGKVKVSFSVVPKECSVVVATVLFQIQEEPDKVLKLSAIGKYAYVTLNKSLFHFGDLLVDQTETQNLVIKNKSQVPTTFHIEEDQEMKSPMDPLCPDNSFSFDVTTGVVPAGSSFLVKVKYTPSVVYMLSSKNYIIRTDSGNSQRMTCLGSGMGLDVSLSSRVCNFGEVRSGNKTSRLITIQNHSSMPCSYKFFVDKRHIFQFKQTEGTIAPRSNARLVIYFSPQETMAYYERVFCLVRNHIVLYLDLLGTCYDILQRPIPLSQKDVEVFRTNILMGSYDKLLESNPAAMATTQELYGGSAEIPMDEPNQIALHKELFLPLKDRVVSLSEENIDFGFCLENRLSEERNVYFKNNLPFTVYVLWIIPGETQPKFETPQCFFIKPSSATVGPQEGMNFKFQFKPYEPASYFYQSITCQVYIKRPKNQQSDELGRMSTSQTLQTKPHLSRVGLMSIPPLSLNIPLIGHSFPKNFQTFIPNLKVYPKRTLMFPPVAPGDSVYQSLQVYNQADTPCYYRILPDETGTFKVYPSFGFIYPKNFALVVVEFKPEHPKNYEFSLKFALNHGNSQNLKVKLFGVCSEPKIYIENEAKIYYPPLFTGVSSKQRIGISNSSHIPIEYQMTIPEKYRDELTIEPFCGTMYPHERVNVEFAFTAIYEKQYKFNVPIVIKRVMDMAQEANFIGYFNPGSGKYMHNLRQDSLEKHYHITVIGSGGTGMVQMSPKFIDFETVSVGFSAVKSFTLSNVSNCAIYVKLAIAPKAKDTKNEQFTSEVIDSSFVFDFKEGILAANSNQKVNLRFVPNCRSLNHYYVKCMAKQSFPNSSTKETPLNEDSMIEVKAHGDFPVISILDLRAKDISPSKLWRQFSLTETIEAILSPLTQEEELFNEARLPQEEAYEKFNVFEWDFGTTTIPRMLESRKIRLTLKNIGGVPASYKFVFPDDNKLEKEIWADSGEPTPEAAFEERILAQRIFEIKPKEGNLDRNEVFDVELRYNPVEVGKHNLTILFQIIHGKPILLKLKGETLPPKKGHLELRNDFFEFEPLPTGLTRGVAQPVELKNLGDVKVNYEVDTSALEEFNKQNFDFPVFEIQNKEGVVDALELKCLYFMFKPLESTEYELTLPIIVKERNTVVQHLQITLKGRGYILSQEMMPESPTIFPSLPLCRQSFLPESSEVGFSTEYIDFGKCCPESPKFRTVFIYNKSPKKEFKFTFKETELVCGDELIIDPFTDIVRPGSQVPIKFCLRADRIPTIYEGELECVIEWEGVMRSSGKIASSKKSFENTSNLVESIFLRVSKTSELKAPFSIQNDNDEPELIKNVLNSAIKNILSEESIKGLVEEVYNEPSPLVQQLSNSSPNNMHNLESLEDVKEEEDWELEPEYSQDRLFLKEEFQELAELILESTIFNIVSEATSGENDLLSFGKTYVKTKPSIE